MITREQVMQQYREALPGKVMGFFLDHRPLSNFHLEPFTWRGVVWPASEQAYQAMKSDDPKEWERFSKLSCVEAKNEGGKIQLKTAFWDDIKFDIMLEILRIKFRDCPIARQVLLSTGDAHLEECNWWKDQCWGTVNGYGKNNLGKILMKVREEISHE